MNLQTSGWLGEWAQPNGSKTIVGHWTQARAREGGVFLLWAHSREVVSSWEKFEDFVSQFAHQPDVWYANQGELFTWIWLRKNTQLDVTGKRATKTTVMITRPWLAPWLSGKVPMSLKVPVGVEQVLWQGRPVPVTNGFVELSWTAAKPVVN